MDAGDPDLSPTICRPACSTRRFCVGWGASEEALVQFREAIQTESLGNRWSGTTSATSAGNWFMPDEAEHSLRQALALQPDLPEALNNLGCTVCRTRSQRMKPNPCTGRPIDGPAGVFQGLAQPGADPDSMPSGTRTFRQMRELFERHADDDFAVMQLGFALGKVSEDLGEYRRSVRTTGWRATGRSGG